MKSGVAVRTRGVFAVCACLWAAPLAGPAAADQPPAKIAVFDFELSDFSAGAGIGDQTADRAYLDKVTRAIRRLLADSGRYSVVDVSRASEAAVKERSLWQCGGCAAPIALKLGADQSFVGVVTRISRTEYTVSFRVRDAHTGAILHAGQSGLLIGADYSWDRGAASLIRTRLVETR
jgi:hypothetical protein